MNDYLRMKLATLVGTSVLFLVSLVVVLGIWYGVSWMEARAFNKITGSNVSAWDAMWVELRVQESSAEAK